MKLDFNKLLDYVKGGSFTVEKHPAANLFIFGYLTGPIMINIHREWDALNKLMRGLIVDSDGNVVARSFEKFFTYKERLSDSLVATAEGQVIDIGNGKPHIYEKVDGTLSMLYWIDDKPYLATQRSFTSLKAKRATRILYQKYKHIIPKLKRDRTYIFEAIYPECSVLIDYGDREDLILLGEIDNETGESLPLENIGFTLARDYSKEYDALSFDELKNLNLKNQEGFVLLFDNNQRLKVKFPWYNQSHMYVDKYLEAEFALYRIEVALKKSLGITMKTPDTEEIWARFRNGESPKSILSDFPSIYNVIGIEEILNNEYRSFISAKKEGDVILRPPKNRVFDLLEMMRMPCNELVMWNRLDRIKRHYI